MPGSKREEATGNCMMSSFITCTFLNIFRGSSQRELQGEITNSYKILVGKPEGKRSLGRPKCRWEGTNKINLKERM
jgi:hypothetical protein